MNCESPPRALRYFTPQVYQSKLYSGRDEYGYQDDGVITQKEVHSIIPEDTRRV